MTTSECHCRLVVPPVLPFSLTQRLSGSEGGESCVLSVVADSIFWIVSHCSWAGVRRKDLPPSLCFISLNCRWIEVQGSGVQSLCIAMLMTTFAS